MIFLPVLIFVLGLLVGSFLNVVIFRMNTGRTVVTGRSKCSHCARELHWYELIPVLSFLSLRGRCRTCRAHLSFQYPVVELITALVFVIAYIRIILLGSFDTLSWLSFIFACVVASIVIVITIYDLKHKIIPDMAVYPLILLAVLSIFVKYFLYTDFDLFRALVEGVIVALPFFLLWYLSNGRVMGFGDVKLSLAMGWLLGLSGGLMAVLISFWVGGIVGLFLLGASRKYGMKSEIPFGPFLVIGLFIVGLWNVTISSVFNLWP